MQFSGATMTRPLRVLVVFSAVLAAAAAGSTVDAHFRLLAPAGMLVDNERGDPQKAAPCGSAPDAQRTGALGKAVGGSMLKVRVQETVYHPGHYRVALAVNSVDELPPDPVTTERITARGPVSVWAVIQSPPQVPVIADGLFQHYTRPAAPPAGAAREPVFYEADVPLPNITCPKCLIQVVQFMAEHDYNQPGGYSYHHCAEIAITADASKPLDTRWPAVKATAAD
jgi:hypothetical protein